MSVSENRVTKPIGCNNEKLSLNDGFIHSTMNKLTLNSQKSWLYLVYRVFHKLKDKDTFDIPIKDLITYLQVDTRNYAYLNDCLKSIRRTYITFNITGKDKGDWIESPLLADVGIVNGNIVYSFSPLMREKLQDPKFFTVLNLTLISNFKSKYSLAIYRQLASYIIKSQVTTQKKYTLEELKYYLQIDEEYSEFRLFNNKVLKPALEEINQFTPISVEAEFKRENRKVSEIKFIFSLKNNLPVEETNRSDKKLLLEAPILNQNTTGISLTEKIILFCTNNSFPYTFINKYKDISLEKGIIENEYLEYIEFIIEIINKMKKDISKGGTLTNSLKDGRYVNVFNNRMQKPQSDLDKLDMQMSELLNREINSFIKVQYEKYIIQFLTEFFANNNDLFNELITELSFKNIFVSGAITENDNQIDLSLLRNFDVISALTNEYDLCQISNDFMDFKNFKKYFENDPEKQKDLQKHKKTVFHSRYSEIYSHNPYLKLNDIKKRLGV